MFIQSNKKALKYVTYNLNDTENEKTKLRKKQIVVRDLFQSEDRICILLSLKLLCSINI